MFLVRSSSAYPAIARDTFDATQDLAQRAGLTFAQFVMLTPFPGTVDFEKWEKAQADDVAEVDGIPVDALLAHSRVQAAEDVHAASHHEFGGDASAHPARVGSFL